MSDEAPKSRDPPAPEAFVGTDEWDGDLVEVTEGAPIDGSVRDLGATEREALVTLLSAYGDGILDRLEETFVLKVIGRKDIEPQRRVFAMRRPTLAQLAAYDPIFLGIPVAHLGRKGARLTLEGGRLISPFATRRVIQVNEKASQLFLYGRHIFRGSIVKVQGRPGPEDEVLVTDAADGLYLGLGVAEEALRPAARGGRGDATEIAVHNRADLGLYLRAQQAIPE